MKGGQNSSGRGPRSLTAGHLSKTKISHSVFGLSLSRVYLHLKQEKRDYHKSIYIEITELKLKIFGKTKCLMSE